VPTHWFHKVAGRTRRLVAYAAGEVAEVDQGRMGALLTACPACRREVEAYRLVSAALRASPRAELTLDEAAAFWPGVSRRIRRGATPAAQPVRPTFREIFWDHPRLSLASATAAIVLVLGLTLGPRIGWGPGSSGSNGAEVVSVEAGENASVMLFQAPGSSLKVIWVFEAPSS
jgi:anti-sigma factor RsiW